MRIGENTHLNISNLLVGCRKSWALPRTSTWPPAKSKNCQSLMAGGLRTASSFSLSMCSPCLFGPCSVIGSWWEGMGTPRPQEAEA